MRCKPLHSFFLLIVIGLASCVKPGNKFTIVGEIKDMPPQNILLEEISLAGPILLDSVRSDDAGKFEFSNNAPEPGVYRLKFSKDQYILLSIDKGNLKVSGDWKAIYDYKVSGSHASGSLRDFLGNLRGFSQNIHTYLEIIKAMKARGNDSLMRTAEADMRNETGALTQYIENYSDTTVFLPNAVFAVQILNFDSERPFIDAFSQSLNRRFPNAKLAKDYAEYVRKREEQSPVQQPQQQAAQVSSSGMAAPDLKLNTPDGKEVSLSSMKGKFVLVDFWASWCGPCRHENPNVVAAYQKFKNKNFTILGVSLDDNKDDWEKAIKDDKLEWTQVSDLKRWESAAVQIYQLQSIPSNVLVDPDGKIIASDLRGEALESMLQQVLK